MFSWPEFVNSLPVIITAAATVGILITAWIQATKARTEASRRAAFEYIQNELKGVNNFSVIKMAYPNSVKFSDEIELADGELFEGLDSSKLLTDFIAILDGRELLAQVILKGDFHSDTIRHSLGKCILSEWEYSKPYISKLRQDKKNLNIYSKFEKLALKWL